MTEPNDDFDCENFKAPIFEGLTIEDHKAMSSTEKWRRMGIAWQQARDAHRAWFLLREPDAEEIHVWGDWMRVTGCAAIMAKGMRDAAERDADTPLIVEARP